MKINVLLCGCFLVFNSISCNNKKSNDTVEEFELKSDSYNFENILKCGYYDFRETYFVTADNGCIYNGKSNTIGNAVIFLVPKKELNEKITKNLNDYISKLSAKEIKDFFEVFISIIPKAFLVNTPEGYYQKDKYVRNFYTYKENNNEWVLIDTKEIKSKEEEQKDFIFLESYIQKSLNKNDSFEIDQKWIGDFQFDFDGSKMEEDFEGNIVFHISKEGEVYLTQKSTSINSVTGKIAQKKNKDNIVAKIIKNTSDTLVVKTTEENREYILFKEKGSSNYGVTGKDVKIINLEYDTYTLTKIK
ncbi:hypothetical protein BWK58_07200 [Flavobacterium columnare]|nr:hypothetical protein BWK58_07200 [Flavobacterium columnare]